MKIRKAKKAKERLAVRIADWEKTCKSSGDSGKGFKKPGSMKR